MYIGIQVITWVCPRMLRQTRGPRPVVKFSCFFRVFKDHKKTCRLLPAPDTHGLAPFAGQEVLSGVCFFLGRLRACDSTWWIYFGRTCLWHARTREVSVCITICMWLRTQNCFVSLVVCKSYGYPMYVHMSSWR